MLKLGLGPMLLAGLLILATFPGNTTGCSTGDWCYSWFFLCFSGQPWACSYYYTYCIGGGGEPVGGGGGGVPCSITGYSGTSSLNAGESTSLYANGCTGGAVTFMNDCSSTGYVSGNTFYATNEGTACIIARCQTATETCYDTFYITVYPACNLSASASPSQITTGETASLNANYCWDTMTWSLVSGPGSVYGSTYYSSQPGWATIQATCWRHTGTPCYAETYVYVTPPPNNCPCDTPLSESEWNAIQAIGAPPPPGSYAAFPSLVRDHTCRLGPADSSYNCLGYASGLNITIFTELDNPQYGYGGNRDGLVSIAELDSFCSQNGVSNVWYYGSSSQSCHHVAKKSGGRGSDCGASSKMGHEALIAHDATELEGSFWGNIVGGR